jgi:hypothetical protein
MQNEQFKNDYTQTLLTKLWHQNREFEYGTLDQFINNLLYNKNNNYTIEQVSEFTNSLTKNLDVIMMRKKEEIANPKLYIVNGYELNRDYYSLRTEAATILGVSPPTLYKKVKDGTIKILPGFEQQKISAEELYNYYCRYGKIV